MFFFSVDFEFEKIIQVLVVILHICQVRRCVSRRMQAAIFFWTLNL